ncbi:hypothetical protein HYFRA_00008415 [Hymenoscyphus fraxineus]|uniref:Uncharacterized protein n=1 Tax=Hymenoscyphus fraxineus TaxID=746836 RepID=A0A9N9KNG4_9HELO|nr:hypothetical protein HYFRA_00008415 [Hymenoscyphus fraxineus]
MSHLKAKVRVEPQNTTTELHTTFESNRQLKPNPRNTKPKGHECLQVEPYTDVNNGEYGVTEKEKSICQHVSAVVWTLALLAISVNLEHNLILTFFETQHLATECLAGLRHILSIRLWKAIKQPFANSKDGPMELPLPLVP